MNTSYTIDLSLRPTTFDLWHVCLAGTVAVLALLLIVVLLISVLNLLRGKNKVTPVVVSEPAKPVEPIIQVVEKIVEVEKIVKAPAPEPVVLKEATPDAALQLLAILQNEARFIDFIQENITSYSDADIGVAARVVHEGCNKAIKEHFTLAPVRAESEGARVTLPAGFDASKVRVTGHIVGQPPFTGTLIHKGWQVTAIHLPKLTQGYDASIVAAAEVEL
ncbi:DUF2760 domain-containing protein [Methylocucumis oryzae]|uniref:DUF2760 domain-containing protein n=1 Tax=Methylocucumis oryzae TaxID=1632867 RepID=A0A0F3IP41_9GAMM|nr:DUF2760 domain-containing protein [Methylocucumis oryzae]KJV07354.1 hypothetical protein VZ94_05215 [Methylocucumis oryzae]